MKEDIIVYTVWAVLGVAALAFVAYIVIKAALEACK